MAECLHLVAIDLGASSGRVVLGEIAGGKLSLREMHRFEHRPIHVPEAAAEGVWGWDVLAVWEQIKRGIALAAQAAPRIDGIGIDSWGVDYGLVDAHGRLVQQVIAYRDPRTLPVFERVVQRLGREDIYSQTGIQFLNFNTLYQLAADAEHPARPLQRAAAMLMIPQLFSFWLTGRQVAEHTEASTTQLYNSRARSWITEFAGALNIPQSILPEVVDAGTVMGTLRPTVADELHLPQSTPVIAVGSHDTASAVVASPLADDRCAYLSSGTWSLLGVELPAPVITPAALEANLTNEAGVWGTTRLLKNVNGMWIIQECRRVWADAGNQYSFEQLTQRAAREPATRARIDPNHPSFSAPGDMPARIAAACREAGCEPPDTPAAVVRCVLESLASSYAGTLRQITQVTGRSIATINVVGGGARNDLLNQLTADATGCRVVAGPYEATAIGNLLVQAKALGAIETLQEARQCVRNSFELHTCSPSGATSDSV